VASQFWNDFRRFFLRGLAAVLPTVLTVIILLYAVDFVQEQIGRPINFGISWVLDRTPLEPPAGEANWYKWWQDHWYMRGVGFVLAIIGVYFLGRFVASFIGRGVWRLIDRGLLRMPLIKLIYPSVKQVTDFLLSERKMEFSRVVAVEYPRKGIWSVGLVTGPGMGCLQEATGTALLSVFIPSSPTPVTGYTITVRREDVVDLALTIDEALRFTVSAGVVLPQAADRLGKINPAQRMAEAVRSAAEDHDQKTGESK
jgi:uncharacterized membrane protein